MCDIPFGIVKISNLKGIIPKDKLGTGAVICLSNIDFPIDKDNYAIPLSYI